MISPLRATGIIASGTAVYLVIGVLVGKALALFVGPPGVGIWGLMQSTTGILGIIVGLGVATSLVRSVARAVSAGRLADAQNLRLGSLALAVFTTLALFLVSLPTAEWVATSLLGSASFSGAVPLLALAVGFSLIGAVEQGALNGWHRIRQLTMVVIASSILGGVATVLLVAAFGVDGIAPGLLITAVSGAGVGAVGAALVLGPVRIRAVRQAVSGIREIVLVGSPYALSQGVGTGAQLLVPVVVLFLLDSASVGYYRAAATISVGYLAFVLNAFAQDYYPRVAAAEPLELRGLIERQTRLVLALGVPLVLVTLALAPLVVTVLYSNEFFPAVDILRWQLVGDLLKLPAWAMAFAVLARGRSVLFFATELAFGFSLLLGVWAATSWWGLQGAGIAYLFSYGIYYLAVWLAVRRVAPVVPGRLQLGVVGLVVVLVVSEIVLASQTLLWSGLVLAAAGVAAVLGWPQMLRRHRAGTL